MNDQTSNPEGNLNRPVNRNKNTNILFLIATLLLLGTGIYLFAENASKTKLANRLTTEVAESEDRYKDLDSKYNDALAEIDSYKGKNAALDSVLAVKERYILGLKADLESNKKKFRLSEADYKRQLSNLNLAITNMNAQLDSVQRQNRILLVANDSLGRNLTEKINENTLLTSTNNTLSQKVTVASLLLPQNIDLSGIRTKSNGKQKDTEKAKKADQLKLCFEVPENHVADPGMKTLFIRIINPQGVPLAIQDRGSGVFTTVESGQESQYTTVANVDYKQQRDNVCVNWSQGTPFESGKYVAEIYQDGYLVGKKEYELR